MIPEHYH
jgi:predicted phage-related endonuclease